MVADYLYLEPGYGKNWVEETINRYLRKSNKKVPNPPSKAHEIMTLIRWRTIFTTNYDNLIENSYSNPKRVQDPLPIYNPDSSILRKHEKEIIRIIKLNGSADEMSRNSKHHLVITFADQQDGRSINQAFYELLREESINGPIIFIGFRFQHPGAQIAGTSPEFLLLKELLRDMGSARWHYCISPTEPNSIESELAIKTLKANQIHVINLKFGEFLTRVQEELANPSISLAKRSPIIIPIAHSSLSIDAEDYSRDRNHFEIVGSHLEQLPKCSVSDSLNGGENWCSFFENHFIERQCRNDFLAKLRDCIDKPPGLISFVASPGWGKTFFLKSISVELFKGEGRPILWLNPFGTLDMSNGKELPIIACKWDEKRIDYIIGLINNEAENHNLKNGEVTPIIIADNCPERVEEILSLFRYLNSNNREFIILIAFRDNEFETDLKNHALLKRGVKFWPEKNLYDNTVEVRRLIDFCEKNKVGSIENEMQKGIIAQRITESKADVALILALQIIYDGQHRPFSEIIKGFWNSIDIPLFQIPFFKLRYLGIFLYLTI